jgi:uroporphyrinogen-III synthase
MQKIVVITRPSGPYEARSRFADKIRAAGFKPFQLPVLVCAPIPPTVSVRVQLSELLQSPTKAWLAFLSPTAVWAWKDLMTSEPLMETAVKQALLAVQGVGTADACRECFGRAPDFVPSVFVAEEFAKEFAQVLKAGERVLVPQSAEGRDLLAPTLASKGHKASSFSLYRLEQISAPKELLDQYRSLRDSETYVVFMSPSAVRATVEAVGSTLESKKLLSVGPLTSQAIRKAGLTVWREATEHSEDGVLRELSSLAKSQVS